MNAMNDHDARVRGARAQQILDDPVAVEAFKAVEASIIAEIATGDLRQPQIFHLAAIRLQALHRIREQLESYMTTGMLTEPQNGKPFA